LSVPEGDHVFDLGGSQDYEPPFRELFISDTAPAPIPVVFSPLVAALERRPPTPRRAKKPARKSKQATKKAARKPVARAKRSAKAGAKKGSKPRAKNSAAKRSEKKTASGKK
jgi:hypothetical protein